MGFFVIEDMAEGNLGMNAEGEGDKRYAHIKICDFRAVNGAAHDWI